MYNQMGFVYSDVEHADEVFYKVNNRLFYFVYPFLYIWAYFSFLDNQPRVISCGFPKVGWSQYYVI